MRHVVNGLCLVALGLWSNLAAATPSISGTTIPSAAQIVDTEQNVWTLSGGEAYENGKLTPSSGVILLLCSGGVVYQENIHHNWWVWDSTTDILRWVASSDPRVISPSGTTIPSATQIVDNGLNVWTLSGGLVYEKGQRTPSSEVISLLYAKGIVYQENIHHNWWLWRDGAWVATSAPPLPSPRGTAIPTATQLVDSELDLWTVSGGQAYENHALTPSSGVILLLFYDGNVYQENIHHNWWQWNGHAWISTASDPRAGQPMAYVASCSPAPCSPDDESVTVIDTATNRVTGTIRTAVQVSYMAVTPDAKHVYALGPYPESPSGSLVAVIDTAQKRVVTYIPLLCQPQGIVASPDGTKIYVLGSSYSPRGTTACVIDTTSNAVVASISLPGFLQFGSEIAISPDGKRLYVPGHQGLDAFTPGAIDVIDTATHSLVSHFASPPYEYFQHPSISPDNARLYSNAYYPDPSSPPPVPPVLSTVIAVFDPATGGVKATLPGVMTVGVFSPDAQHLYGLGLGGVAVLDTATNVPTTAVANVPYVAGLAITPDGKHLYMSDQGLGVIMVADTATYTISTVLPLSVTGTGQIAIVAAH